MFAEKCGFWPPNIFIFAPKNFVRDCRDFIGPPGKQLAQAVSLVTYVVYGRLAVL